MGRDRNHEVTVHSSAYALQGHGSMSMCPLFGAHQAVDTQSQIPSFLKAILYVHGLMCPWLDVYTVVGTRVCVCVDPYAHMYKQSIHLCTNVVLVRNCKTYAHISTIWPRNESYRRDKLKFSLLIAESCLNRDIKYVYILSVLVSRSKAIFTRCLDVLLLYGPWERRQFCATLALAWNYSWTNSTPRNIMTFFFFIKRLQSLAYRRRVAWS